MLDVLRRVSTRLTERALGGVRLSARGGAFLALAVLSFITAYTAGLPVLVAVGCLLVALPATAVLFVRLRRPRLAVVRILRPPIVQVGEPTLVALTVKPARGIGGSGGSVAGSWWDALPWSPGASAEFELPAFRARAAAQTLRYDLVPLRRGVYPIGPMAVAISDGLGLASSLGSAGEAQQLTVTPEVVPLADSGLSIPAGDGESRLVQRRATGDDDDAMTREYRRGDAMRRVHWRASARHGDLMVRQEEQRSFPEARIIVDTLRSGYRDVDFLDNGSRPDGTTDESASFEWVVRMLASVAVHLRREGFQVAIDETGANQLDSARRGHRRTWGDEEFLSGLATLELTNTPAEALDGAASDHHSRGPLIALLASPNRQTIEWLGRQRRQGELAVAFMVRDLSAIELIDRSLGVASDASAVAEQLGDAGWLVVPVRADDDHAAAWEAVVVETSRARNLG
ncbi:MAG: DUF58 domain-containing protein [Salinibacterium sp.]|nr:DUF58 domain-containing protein [Salinibacterium sp.]